MATSAAQNHWIELYGDRIIDRVYETSSGYIWLVEKRKPGAGHDEGLVYIFEAEWGMIDIEALELLRTDKTVKRIQRPHLVFKEKLPCTLRELFAKTPVASYFE